VRSLLRRAASDATVLLKNDKSVLPLKATIKSIAVIGPTAKEAFTSGGGSARLAESYRVSPLNGIRAAAQEIGADVKFAIGVTTYKYLPLVDDYIQQSGKPGALLEFWNEEPVPGWMDGAEDGESPVWSTHTRGSYCFMIDGIVSIYNSHFIFFPNPRNRMKRK